LVYIERALERGSGLATADLELHRLFLTSMVIAAKFHDDMHCCSSYYAKVGGVTVAELTKLEAQFMTMLDWRLYVTEDEYKTWLKRLSSQKESPRLSPKQSEVDIQSSTASISFPRPTALEGVKSRKKVILRMEDVVFCHPGEDSPVLKDMNLTMSQASCTLLVGGELAGKTTALKILAGEEVPTQGLFMKASGLRVSCFAERTLHRLDDHAHETPEQYMMWRFAGNMDREALEIQKFADTHQAYCNQAERQLTSPDITEFLRCFGVDQESAGRQVGQLSTAMKVRVCLAAAMWQSPHILLLDEPAALLDEVELRHLFQAIKGYKGGVFITARTKDQGLFEGIATEKLFLQSGQLLAQSISAKPKVSNRSPGSQPRETCGNTKGNDSPNALSAKDARAAIKDLEHRLRVGMSNKMSDEQMCEMVDQLKGKLLA
jgi:ATPase subunit of ABC transporter with duplicated ATPase domains